MAKVTTSDLQKGMFIDFRDEPHQIVDVQFYNPGKGSSVYRTRLKSLRTQRVLDFTFKSGESAQEIAIETKEMQYLYKQDKDYIFMNQATFDQVSIPEDLIGSFHKVMKEGEVYQVMLLDGASVGIRYPKKVKLLVTQADEGAKGNTVGGAKKSITLETGLSVLAPLFIKEGDTVVVDVDTLEYVERASQK